ncbi:helix-turn-helix domain-containing protein [bacterium]|nr:helix-turn-helix domain-containing protein [bacterium]
MASSEHFALKRVELDSQREWCGSVPRFLFVFPREGDGVCVAGRNQTPLTAGDVLLSSQPVTPRLRLLQGHKFTFQYFSLASENLFPLLVGHEISLLQKFTERPSRLRVFPAESSVAMRCHRLVAETPPTLNMEHRSQLLRIAGAVLAEEFSAFQRQRLEIIRLDQNMVQLFEKLSTDELLQCSVSDLASRFGCSRRHLNRLFHQYFNSSVGALRKELRLLKSVSLLRDREAKIITIAEECGFSHLGLFNSSFKSRFGVTPGQWRKQWDLVPNQKQSSAARMANSDSCFLMSQGLCPMAGAVQRNGASSSCSPNGPTDPEADVRSIPLPPGDSPEPESLPFQFQFAAWTKPRRNSRMSL